jgi:hypothetical protein
MFIWFRMRILTSPSVSVVFSPMQPVYEAKKLNCLCIHKGVSGIDVIDYYCLQKNKCVFNPRILIRTGGRDSKTTSSKAYIVLRSAS